MNFLHSPKSNPTKAGYYSPSGTLIENLPPAAFKRGDVVRLRLNRQKYGIDMHDFKGYDKKEVIITFIDNESEPRYGIQPLYGNLPVIFVNSDELEGECISESGLSVSV
jgi:hypothetical protein